MNMFAGREICPVESDRKRERYDLTSIYEQSNVPTNIGDYIYCTKLDVKSCPSCLKPLRKGLPAAALTFKQRLL